MEMRSSILGIILVISGLITYFEAKRIKKKAAEFPAFGMIGFGIIIGAVLPYIFD